MKRFVVANWKMNLTLPEAEALSQRVRTIAEDVSHVEIIIAPSSPWLVPLNDVLRIAPKNLSLAGQAVSEWSEGAYTGDISAKQLQKLVTYCLVGHSERRRYHHETGAVISAQIKQLLACGIIPIVCFGEMNQSKQSSFSSQITTDLAADLHGLSEDDVHQCLFAYEPLWAIGTGNAATPEYVMRAVDHVKKWSQKNYNEPFRVLYGGSVSEDNAGALGGIAHLDGLLVGGASLQPKRFGHICERFCARV